MLARRCLEQHATTGKVHCRVEEVSTKHTHIGTGAVRSFDALRNREGVEVHQPAYWVQR